MLALYGNSTEGGLPPNPGAPSLTLPTPPEAAVVATDPSPNLPWPLRALRDSVWTPVLLRATGLGAVFVGLAAIGAVSVAIGLPGTNELPPGFAVAGLATSWLAPARGEASAAPNDGAARDSASHAAHGDTGAGSIEVVPAALSAGGAGDGAAPPLPSCGSAPSGPAPAGSASASPSRPSGLTPDGKVILNTATGEELTRLPGVGPKRAESILALRDRLGRFRRGTDLLRVRGIGPATLQKMQPHFVLDPPAEPPPPTE